MAALRDVPWPIQAQLLEAAAHATRLLEDGAVHGRGTHARLFRPVHGAVDDGHPPTAPAEPDYTRRWDQAKATLDEALRLAREDPAEAQALYNVFAAGCRTPQSIERLLGAFEELGIRTAALSHKQAA